MTFVGSFVFHKYILSVDLLNSFLSKNMAYIDQLFYKIALKKYFHFVSELLSEFI